jgi:hypothetical protein
VWERAKRWWRLGRSYVLTLVGMNAVALAVHLVSDFGEDIDQNFYAAAAQVIPVLFIALLFEVASIWGPGAADARDRLRDLEQTTGDRTGHFRAELRQADVRLRTLEEKPVPPEERWRFGEQRNMLAEMHDHLNELERDISDVRAFVGGVGTAVLWTVMTYVIAGFAGEGVALAALAIDESSTYVFMLTAESLFVMLFLLTYNFQRRFRA